MHNGPLQNSEFDLAEKARMLYASAAVFTGMHATDAIHCSNVIDTA